MTARRPALDAREVDRFEAVVTVDDAARVDEFLRRCVPRSSWMVRIRTAELLATVLRREPLGTIDERTCTCLSIKLTLPVPVEPALRFHLAADDDETLTATGVVRPWGD